MLTKKVTSKDVARVAGVSQSTVSLVLNGRDDLGICEETKKKVIRTASEMGYRTNRIAASLVSGKTYNFGMLLSHERDAYSIMVLESRSRACAFRNYGLLVAVENKHTQVSQELHKMLFEHRVDALIMMCSLRDEPYMLWQQAARNEQIPVIIIDSRDAEGTEDTVISDDKHGIDVAMEHLYSLGHRKICHVAGSLDSNTAAERKSAYIDFLKNAGIPVFSEWIVGNSWNIAECRAAVGSILDSEYKPTAILAASDQLACAVLVEARSRGIKIPDQLSIIGYGDTCLASQLMLTSVSQNTENLGKMVTDRLFKRIDNPDLKPETIVSSTELVIRESTAERKTK